MNEKGILIILSGFAGSGKGTIIKELLKKYDNYALSVSATTRKPREGEETPRDPGLCMKLSLLAIAMLLLAASIFAGPIMAYLTTTAGGVIG